MSSADAAAAAGGQPRESATHRGQHALSVDLAERDEPQPGADQHAAVECRYAPATTWARRRRGRAPRRTPPRDAGVRPSSTARASSLMKASAPSAEATRSVWRSI